MGPHPPAVPFPIPRGPITISRMSDPNNFLNHTEAALEGAIAPPYNTLLAAARDYLAKGDSTVAVIMAETAAELRTEAVLFRILRNRRQLALDEAIRKTVRRYNICQERVWLFYSALTEDAKMNDDEKIKKQPFWQRLTRVPELRHRILHRGGQATQQQAEDAVTVVAELFTYLEGVEQKALATRNST